jgi:S-adenosylmethionine hydrolase
MKGVILDIAADAQIADISHGIAPQDVHQAAFVLARTAPYFPAGTVHVVVVDPGVGTERRPIAARIGKQNFVAPDNGVLTYIYQQAERRGEPIQVVHLDNPVYWLPEISNVFHGRDIFSPVGAHLTRGVPLLEVGHVIEDMVRIPLPQVEKVDGGLRGQVVLIDNFGNLLTNLERGHLEGFERLRFRIRGVEIGELSLTFGSRQPGDLVAVIGEENDLTISVVNGSARELLGAQVGDAVEVQGKQK